jgi:protein-disulfide isomerase
MRLRPALATCIPLLVLTLGCPPPEQTAEPGQEDQEEGGGTAAAQLNGETIPLSDVDAWIKEQLFAEKSDGRDPTALYLLRLKALDSIIHQRLLEKEAAPLAISTEELIRQETERRVTIGDEELLAFYEENKERMGEVSFEEMKPRIQSYLQRQRGMTAAQEYVEELRSQAAVEVPLDTERIEVEARGPSLGPDEAPVTIIEFSDYRCGFCRKVESTLQRLLERYPSEVRLIPRHFPLNQISRGAAEAAACANDQGRFWEYHRGLFAAGGKLDTESLEQRAGDAELDLEAFRTCVGERRFKADVEADLADGRRAGVSGTPAFFVNGIRIKGARPFEDFVVIIEQELRRSGG